MYFLYCLLCKAKRKLTEITLKHLNAKLQSLYRKRRPRKQRPKTVDPLQNKDHLENEDSLENKNLLENEDPLEKHHVRLSFQDLIQIDEVFAWVFVFDTTTHLVPCKFRAGKFLSQFFLAYYDLFLSIFFPTFCPTFFSNCFSIFFLTFFPNFFSTLSLTFFLSFCTADHIYQRLILELKCLSMTRFDS